MKNIGILVVVVMVIILTLAFGTVAISQINPADMDSQAEGTYDQVVTLSGISYVILSALPLLLGIGALLLALRTFRKGRGGRRRRRTGW